MQENTVRLHYTDKLYKAFFARWVRNTRRQAVNVLRNTEERSEITFAVEKQ
jgi:hypothetical protein